VRFHTIKRWTFFSDLAWVRGMWRGSINVRLYLVVKCFDQMLLLLLLLVVSACAELRLARLHCQLRLQVDDFNLEGDDCYKQQKRKAKPRMSLQDSVALQDVIKQSMRFANVSIILCVATTYSAMHATRCGCIC